MDRDVAQLLLTKITAIKTALQNIATNTNPSIIERSAPAENQRSVPEAPEEEPEAPEEPETRTKK